MIKMFPIIESDFVIKLLAMMNAFPPLFNREKADKKLNISYPISSHVKVAGQPLTYILN